MKINDLICLKLDYRKCVEYCVSKMEIAGRREELRENFTL
jgi:hypothetical protein